MAYPKSQLHGTEEVVLDLRPHWWFFSRQVLALFVTVAFGVLSLAFEWPTQLRWVIGVLIVVAVGWFGLRYAKWATTNFVITTDRLISRDGILSRSGTEIPLERINTVFFAQSIFERLIGSGDLRIESAGEQGTSTFSDIRRPLDVQNEIYRQMESNENRKFDRVAQGMATGQPSAPESITDQIERLADLRDKGLLTDSEFELKKADLLRRM